MSSWQKKIIASSTQLTAAQKAYFAAATSATAATTAEGAAATGATTGITAFGAALKGAAASAKALAVSLLSNPLTYIIAILGVAAVSAYKFANAFDDAKDAASDSAGVYASTKSEIESLNSKLETTSSRIEELQAQGTLSLSDEAELAKLQRQSAELQNQINLKQRLAEIQSEQSVKDTMDALTVRSSQSKAASENTIYMTGQYTGTNSDKYTDIVTATELDVRRLRELKEENNKLYEDWKVAPESGKDEIQKWIDKNEKEIDKYEETISERMADISELGENLENASSLDSSAQKMLDRIHQLSTAYSSIDLSSVEQNFSALESYFSSSSNSVLKDFITDAVASGEKATDVIGQLGLSLSQIGLPEDAGNDLNKYFQDLAKSASEAANAVDEIDSSLSGIEKASESQNAGDNFDKYLSYIDNARRYYAQGKTGIDDFKTVAASLNNNSQDAEENLKQFKGNLDKIKKYLTTLDDGQLTVTKQNMLDLADAFEVARKKAASTGTEFKSTAELAEALDVPIDFLEYAMGKMQDYNISTAFDDLPKASQNLNDAKTELSALQELYNNMDAGSQKDALGEKIADWKTQISAAEDDLSKLDTDIVLHMKIAYNLAEMQNEIDEARALAQSGGGTTAYAASIAAQEKKNTYQEHQMGLDREGVEVPVVYTAAKDAKDKLQAELNKAAESGDSELVAKLQPQVDDAAKLVGDIQNAIHEKNPTMDLNMNVDEANAKLDEWEKSNAAKDVLINYVTDGQEPPEQMDALMDYVLKYQDSPEDMNALLNYIKNHQDNPDEMNAMLNYLKAYQDNPEAMSAALTYWKKHQDDPDSSTASLRYYWGSQDPAKDDDANVNYKRGEQDPPKNMWAWVRYIFTGDGGGDNAAGTAHSNGSASSRTDNTNTLSGLSYAGGKTRGDWSVGADQTSLINELGAEIVVLIVPPHMETYLKKFYLTAGKP